jgi:hypothetical protein
MMQDIKTAAGSWARAFLVAVLSLAAAGVTEPKALLLLDSLLACHHYSLVKS